MGTRQDGVMENRLEAQLYNSPIRPVPLSAEGVSLPISLRHPSVPPARSPTGVRRSASTAMPQGNSSQSKRTRKDRGPNWMPQEILALIAAKRDMFLEDLDTIDGRDLMTPDNTKWLGISQAVMQCGFSPCVRDGPACKTKWNQLIADYRRIADYLCKTGRNVPEYWDLSPADRKQEGLPKHFAKDVFDSIHEWYGNRPQIQPPHIRDRLAPNDANYKPPETAHQPGEDDHSEPDAEDPMDMYDSAIPEATDESTPPRSPPREFSNSSRGACQSKPIGTPNSRALKGLPPGVTPQVISSSDTSGFTLKRRTGNTAVRRKSVSGHNVIAEATKATRAVMAKHMQEIADSTRELERSKIEVQLKLFSEQMAYQREKDRRLYDNAVAANENARLSILKQGEMVSCLAHLSSVLSTTLNMATAHAPPNVSQTAPRDASTSKITPPYTAAPLSASAMNWWTFNRSRLQPNQVPVTSTVEAVTDSPVTPAVEAFTAVTGATEGASTEHEEQQPHIETSSINLL